jgi:hypothetical protein
MNLDRRFHRRIRKSLEPNYLLTQAGMGLVAYATFRGARSDLHGLQRAAP